MKTKYLKIHAAFLIGSLWLGTSSAQNVTATAPPGDKDWHMGGNQATVAGSTVFGTLAPLNRPVYLYSNGFWRATVFNGAGGFAINRTSLGTNTPGALLHIGDAFGPPGSGGHRTWMNVGTFCWQVTDNMYVGLKDETALFGVDGNILEQFII